MSSSNYNFSAEKFKCFVRYLIQVAKQKRCVPYYELENVFGLSHKQVGYYSGMLGDYCIKRDIPPLNGLVISSTNCKPSEGYDWYEHQYGKSWGKVVSECWKYFHVTTSRQKQVEDFSDRDRDVESFLKEHSGQPGYIV